MAHRDTSVSALCRELGITPVTLYRYVGPQGQLCEQGRRSSPFEPAPPRPSPACPKRAFTTHADRLCQRLDAVLSNMDAELAAREARRDKTSDLKKAIMQELLTGRTRLI